MHAVRRRRVAAHLAGAAHVELVAGEGLRGLVAQLASEGAERRAVEAAAGLEIAHHEVDVVEEAAEVILGSRLARLLAREAPARGAELAHARSARPFHARTRASISSRAAASRSGARPREWRPRAGRCASRCAPTGRSHEVSSRVPGSSTAEPGDARRVEEPGGAAAAVARLLHATVVQRQRVLLRAPAHDLERLLPHDHRKAEARRRSGAGSPCSDTRRASPDPRGADSGRRRTGSRRAGGRRP